MGFKTCFVFAVLSVSTMSSTYAAEEFQDSIPIEVAEALFGFGQGGSLQVYDGIAEGFPVTQFPADFEVIGSSNRSTSITVALVTPLNEENARAALTEIFVDDGWVEMPQFDRIGRETGFVSPNQPPRPSFRQLCHDDHGQLNLSYRERDPRNIVTLGLGSAFGGNFRSCAERIEQQERAMAMSRQSAMGIREQMPLLLVPEEARQGNMPFLRATGARSSGNTAETDTSFALEWELEAVFEHFAEQILEQGWTLDIESIGSVTATGTWVQQTEDGENLVLRLDVVNSQEDRFDLTLRIEGPGGRRGSGVFFSN